MWDDRRHPFCLFAGHERLAAAHRNNAYRCFLPDLTRFTPACCAGPLAACKKTKNNADTRVVVSQTPFNGSDEKCSLF